MQHSLNEHRASEIRPLGNLTLMATSRPADSDGRGLGGPTEEIVCPRRSLVRSLNFESKAPFHGWRERRRTRRAHHLYTLSESTDAPPPPPATRNYNYGPVGSMDSPALQLSIIPDLSVELTYLLSYHVVSKLIGLYAYATDATQVVAMCVCCVCVRL